MSVNICNWLHPENNTWAFQNIDKIFSSHPIKKGEKTSRLDFEPFRFDEFEIKDPDDTSLDLSAFLTGTETDGLIVLHDGKIVFEYYDRTNTEESIHVMMSMTKNVAGLVAGKLVEQGKLDVKKLVSTYVPETIGTSFENVTVRECLDMRSGLKYDNANLEYRKALGLMPLKVDEEPTDLYEFLSTFQAPAAPQIDGLEGAAFDYLSINADLMGWILERASGKEVAELISEELWQPMCAESDAYIAVDRGGNARISGGMSATLRDMVSLGQLLLYDDNGVIPAAWIHDTLHKGSKEAFTAGSWQKRPGRVLKPTAYRSLWLNDSDSEALFGLGIHGQLMVIDRINGIVMVKVSSQPSRLDPRKKDLAIAAFKEFQRILIGSRVVLKNHLVPQHCTVQ